MKKDIFKVLALVIIDQIIKIIILNTIADSGQSITIIPKVLYLTYLGNEDAAFGILSGRILLIALNIMIIFFILRLLLNKKYNFISAGRLGLLLVLAGGFSNLIDRVFRGYVVDYLDITKLIDYPIFNFADICIVIGVVLVIIVIITSTVKSQENRNEKT